MQSDMRFFPSVQGHAAGKLFLSLPQSNRSMPPQLIFINGPTISSSVSSEERRLIRSQIASRHRNALPVPASGQPIPALDDTKARVSATTSYNDADDGDIQDVHINGDVNESERDLQIWSPVSGVQFEPSPTTGVAFFDRQTRDAIDYRRKPPSRPKCHRGVNVFRAPSDIA
jgi:hypothetical protein